MNDFVELRRVFTTVLRWWWLLILSAAIAAAGGYWYSQGQTPVYEATATIIVGQSIQSTDLNRTDIQTSQMLALTYANIVRRQPVLQGAVEKLNLTQNWRGLRGQVRAAQIPDTQLLEIRAEANSPQEAAAIANEVANQLILLSPTALENQQKDETRQFARQRLASLQVKIEAGQERISTLEAAMADSLSAQQVQELQQELNTLENLIAGWENNFTQLLILVEGGQSANYLAIIEEAQANFQPVRPQIETNTLIAGVVGLMLALGLVFLLDFLDDTIKSGDELAQVLDITALGSIGRISGKQASDRLLISEGPFEPVVEAYRIIRSNIQFVSVDRPTRKLMITSSIAGEGKSTTAANLGLMMAKAGLKTIIVDADMRRPMQQYIFQAPSLGGLTELFRSTDLNVSDQLIDTGVENLQLIPCGSLPPNPAELLGSQRMEELLAQLETMADIIICDSPPTLVVADAAVLSSRMDGVVLVIDSGRTRRDAAKQAVATLQRAGAHLLGGVLNRVSKKRSGYSYQGYYAGYRPHSAEGHQQGVANSGSSTLNPGQTSAKLRRPWQRIPFLNRG
jgi:non-specific protein-tyrosine kinase